VTVLSHVDPTFSPGKQPQQRVLQHNCQQPIVSYVDGQQYMELWDRTYV